MVNLEMMLTLKQKHKFQRGSLIQFKDDCCDYLYKERDLIECDDYDGSFCPGRFCPGRNDFSEVQGFMDLVDGGVYIIIDFIENNQRIAKIAGQNVGWVFLQNIQLVR